MWKIDKAKLKRARKAAGLTQEEAAGRVGIHLSTLKRHESGRGHDVIRDDNADAYGRVYRCHATFWATRLSIDEPEASVAPLSQQQPERASATDQPLSYESQAHYTEPNGTLVPIINANLMHGFDEACSAYESERYAAIGQVAEAYGLSAATAARVGAGTLAGVRAVLLRKSEGGTLRIPILATSPPDTRRLLSLVGSRRIVVALVHLRVALPHDDWPGFSLPGGGRSLYALVVERVETLPAAPVGDGK